MTTRTWLDPLWRAEAEAWATAQVEATGRTVNGAIEQPHVAPWATVLRIPTDQGPLWFKASAAGTAYEHRMFSVLAETVPGRVLTPIATDIERAWSVLPDAGTRLRDRLETHPDERFSRWEGVARDHAALQRELMPTVDRLLALGVPDMRPSAIPDQVADLTDWLDLDAAARGRVEEWLPRLTDTCEALATSIVPPTAQQDDLHDGNVLLDGTTYRLVDWGDSSVSHPFGVFLILSISLSRRGNVDPEGPEMARVRDAYLEPFTDLAPLAELRQDLERAAYAQGIPRLCTWQRALATATREEAAEWYGELLAFLAELVATG